MNLLGEREHTLDIKFLIVNPAFISQFFRFALSVSEDLMKGKKYK